MHQHGLLRKDVLTVNKNFEMPELTVISFAVEDVVTTSGGLFSAGAGDNADRGVFSKLFG